MLYNMFPYIHQTSIQFRRQFFALDSISIVSMPDSGFKVFRTLSYILYFLHLTLPLIFLQPTLRLIFFILCSDFNVFAAYPISYIFYT